MKQYKVIITPDAEDDFEKYLEYLLNIKKNPQAYINLLQDFEDTKNSLSNIAGSISEPKSERLRERYLKRMNFLHHNYFLLFYFGDDEIVYITNVFHGLEAFEDKLR